VSARGSASLPLDVCVLGVGVVVTEGLNTGGSKTGASNTLLEGGIGARGPSLEWSGGSVLVWKMDTGGGRGGAALPTASLMLRTSCCSSSNLLPACQRPGHRPGRRMTEEAFTEVDG